MAFLEFKKQNSKNPICFKCENPLCAAFSFQQRGIAGIECRTFGSFLERFHNTHKNSPLCFFTPQAVGVKCVQKNPGCVDSTWILTTIFTTAKKSGGTWGDISRGSHSITQIRSNANINIQLNQFCEICA